MRCPSANTLRVLAIDLYSKGFGFAVVEKPTRLIDYGVKKVKGDKNIACLKKITGLIELYQPDVVVVRDYTSKDFRRSPRVKELTQEILKLALSKRIKAQCFSRLQITKVFSSSGAFTKHQVASSIAEQLPELASRFPTVRKPWMSEDERISIFGAVALALTFMSK